MISLCSKINQTELKISKLLQLLPLICTVAFYISQIIKSQCLIHGLLTLREKCPNTDQKKTPYLDTFHVA